MRTLLTGAAAGAVTGVTLTVAVVGFGAMALVGLIVFVIVGTSVVLHLAGVTQEDLR